MAVAQQFSWLFSSNPLLGAQSISADGSTFTASLQEPFQLPSNAFNVTVEVSQATIWWNTFNVIEGKNFFRFVRANNPSIQLSTIIPPGLYSFDTLNQWLVNYLSTIGVTNYTWTADQPTQRVLQNFTPSPVGIFRTVWTADTIHELLGIDIGLTNYPNVTQESIPGENTARFNTVDYYLIHSSLVSRGIRLNGVYNQLVAQVPIDQPPGSELLYFPQNPPQSPANELVGSVVSQVQFILTDSNNVPVNTRGEAYSVTVVIRWYIPTY